MRYMLNDLLKMLKYVSIFMPSLALGNSLFKLKIALRVSNSKLLTGKTFSTCTFFNNALMEQLDSNMIQI